VKAAARALLSLWELNAQFSSSENPEDETAATTSQSVDAVGWNLAWSWHRIGQEAALKKLESYVRTQDAAELKRVKAAGLQARTEPTLTYSKNGNSLNTCAVESSAAEIRFFS
jgi:hypothetical protein